MAVEGVVAVAEKWSDLRGYLLWRPILMLSHMLLITLVISGSGGDRLWNARVDKQVPFAPIESIYNCSFHTYSPCCKTKQQRVLNNLYKEAQTHRHDLTYIDLMIRVSSFTVFMCIASCLFEIAFLRKVDSRNNIHRLVNKFSICSYVLCLFLLSHGVAGMTPKDPNQGELCGVFRGKQVPEIMEVMSNCYMKLGACRTKDPLTVVLVFMVAYPMLCVACYFCISMFTCWLDLDCDDSENVTAFYGNNNSMNSSTIKDQIKNPHGLTRAPYTVVTITPFSENGNPKTDLRALLRQLTANPSCRSNAYYLARLGQSFQNYIRCGYTPTLSSSTSTQRLGTSCPASVISSPIMSPKPSYCQTLKNGVQLETEQQQQKSNKENFGSNETITTTENNINDNGNRASTNETGNSLQVLQPQPVFRDQYDLPPSYNEIQSVLPRS